MKVRLLVAFVATALMLSAAASAKELYIRNIPFKQAQFVGSTTYVPIDGFLKAAGLKWRTEENRVVIDPAGSSPEITGPTVEIVNQGRSLMVRGTPRGARLYVPVTRMAKFLGFVVLNNPSTGIVDVSDAHFISAQDRKAAAQVAESQKTQQADLQKAWQARVDKLKAEQAAKKAAAEAAAKAGKSGAKGKTASAKSGAKGAKATAKSKQTAAPTKEVAKAAEKPAAEPTPAATTPAKPKVQPKADLRITNKLADPNFYAGTVAVTAVVQNQGEATATDVSADLTLTGPGNRVLMRKTVYGPNIAPDGHWNISDSYSSPDGSSMARGNFSVGLQLHFKSQKK